VFLVKGAWLPSRVPAFERGENNLNGFNDFRTDNGSCQGQNLAWTGLCVPSLLDGGRGGTRGSQREGSLLPRARTPGLAVCSTAATRIALVWTYRTQIIKIFDF